MLQYQTHAQLAVSNYVKTTIRQTPEVSLYPLWFNISSLALTLQGPPTLLIQSLSFAFLGCKLDMKFSILRVAKMIFAYCSHIESICEVFSVS